jgi:hypothetical protein
MSNEPRRPIDWAALQGITEPRTIVSDQPDEDDQPYLPPINYLGCGCDSMLCRLTPDDPLHGLYTTYNNKGCHCDRCRAAMRIKQKIYRLQRTARLNAQANEEYARRAAMGQAQQGPTWDRELELRLDRTDLLLCDLPIMI